MRHNNPVIWFVSLVGLVCFLSSTNGANAQAQERRFFSTEPNREAAPAAVLPKPLACTGPIARVMDVGDEGLKTTSAIYGSSPGGGEGGQFDKTPVLSTKVTLTKGTCLNAHLSAMLGSKQTYGAFFGVSSLALFQVTLTPANGGPRHMVGHFETPYGIKAPAVALEAERDVDMLSANFFQRVGTGPHEVPPGTYRVDVWWAGAPPGVSPGGAIGAAFVLKLYLR